MRPPRLTSRLAARQGIRQVEAHVKADAFADRIDRAFARPWRQVLTLLRDLPAGRPVILSPADQRRVLDTFRGVMTAGIIIFPESLKSLAGWGHRSARDALASELPAKVATVASAQEVDDERTSGLAHGDSLVGLPGSLGGSHGDTGSRLYRGLESQGAARSKDGVRGRPFQARRRLQEDVGAAFSRFLFPAPSEDEVNRIVYAGDWQARLAAGTQLADPSLLASILARGLIAGKTHQEIARELLPHVDNARSSARRVARTEALRVAAVTQMRCHSQLGDLVIGYQIHATLDQHTRPEHAARSGTIYYEDPGPGQLGYEDMPQPPHESPRQGSKLAWNCRCWLTPVLRPLHGSDGASLVPAGTPDPLVFSDWFDQADERRQRVAVGTRRFSLLNDRLGRPPQWSDFLDPETGSLLSQAELAAETPVQRAERAAKANAELAHRRELTRQTSQLGFLRPEPVKRASPRLPGGQRLRFTPHPTAGKEFVLVYVDPRKLDAAWHAANPDEYLPRRGIGPSEVKGRRRAFKSFLSSGEPIQAPRVSLDPSGEPTFTDGRHRFAVLRDAGASRVALSVPRDEADSFRTRFA